MMFPLNATRVYIATGSTDMQKSINGLSLLVEDQMECDPLSGHLFAFCNRKRDIVKILYWDYNGFCLWHKRLEKERFPWPQNQVEVLAISGQKISWLLSGLALEQCQGHQPLHSSTVA